MFLRVKLAKLSASAKADRFNLEESNLLDLLRLRSGQIYHSSPCVTFHLQELLDRGVPRDKVQAVYEWRTSSFFDPAEKAALALCEAISASADTLMLGNLVRRARRFFSNDEIARIVLCILAVDDLNELCRLG